MLDLEPQIVDPAITDAIEDANQFLDFEQAWADFSASIESAPTFMPVQQEFLEEVLVGSISEC